MIEVDHIACQNTDLTPSLRAELALRLVDASIVGSDEGADEGTRWSIQRDVSSPCAVTLTHGDQHRFVIDDPDDPDAVRELAISMAWVIDEDTWLAPATGKTLDSELTPLSLPKPYLVALAEARARHASSLVAP